MDKLKIILISAKAENGKDAFASVLQAMLTSKGKKVVIDHFAKYIKSYCNQMGWNGEKDEYWRNILQQLGTDIIKEKLNYKAFHAKRLAEDIQILNEVFGVEYILLPDTRFKDEIHIMKAMFPNDCVSIRINRIGHVSRLTQEQLKHKSEVDLDDFEFDYVLDVEEGIENLYIKADEILREVLD